MSEPKTISSFEVEPKTLTQTPSGIEIAYYEEPKRKYEIRQPELKVRVESGEYEPIHREWREVPSVTTVLDVLNKPALPWWGMRVGVMGVLALFRLKHLEASGSGYVFTRQASGTGINVGIPQVEELLTEHKLTVNHVKDDAGQRGMSVHNALEVWTETSVCPDPEMYPIEERGYVQGLNKFLTVIENKVSWPIQAEVAVGSLEHGYAGRYDLRLRIFEPFEVPVHRTPVKGPQTLTMPPGEYLIDLKTSKEVYPSHCVQLEAYEQASVECGYSPTDMRAVLHCSANGDFEFVPSWAKFEDFRVVLEVWQSAERMKERRRALGKEWKSEVSSATSK